jgi:hypothetical protein
MDIRLHVWDDVQGWAAKVLYATLVPLFWLEMLFFLDLVSTIFFTRQIQNLSLDLSGKKIGYHSNTTGLIAVSICSPITAPGHQVSQSFCWFGFSGAFSFISLSM